MSSDLRVDPVEISQDLIQGFDVACNAFGHQTRDGIWTTIHPGWDTPEGKTANAERLVKRWRSVKNDNKGNPTAVFLKATLPDPEREGERVVAGFAIWAQISVVEGFGEAPSNDLRKSLDVEARYPGNGPEQRYCCQLVRALNRRRVEVLREKAGDSLPAVLAMDLCAVDPAFQRRGIAKRLVQWGLDEAARRGGLECVMEASSMGRKVYEQMGFKQDGEEFVYEVDAEFADRVRPSNIFMRTGI